MPDSKKPCCLRISPQEARGVAMQQGFECGLEPDFIVVIKAMLLSSLRVDNQSNYLAFAFDNCFSTSALVS